jgi:hypothetical protein
MIQVLVGSNHPIWGEDNGKRLDDAQFFLAAGVLPAAVTH